MAGRERRRGGRGVNTTWWIAESRASRVSSDFEIASTAQPGIAYAHTFFLKFSLPHPTVWHVQMVRDSLTGETFYGTVRMIPIIGRGTYHWLGAAARRAF